MSDDTIRMVAYAALGVLGVIIAISLVRLFILLWRRKEPRSSGVSQERKLEAESAIEAVELLIAKKREEGYDVSEAEEWLNDAKELFSKNRFTSCLSSLEAAKVSLEAAKKIKVKKVKKEVVVENTEKKEAQETEAKESKVEEAMAEEKKEAEEMGKKETEEEVERKREEIKKELEAMEIPEDEMTTEALIKKKMPKDYLPAKFEISVCESRIKEAEKSGKDTEEAKKYLAEAKSHFEAKRYTEAFKAAVRSKKALGIGSEEHIPLEERPESVEEGMEEVIEVTVESGKDICLNCGNRLKPGDKFCRKCGTKVQIEIYCTKCGAKAEPDDIFCGACGNKLRK